jgi:putative lipoprotein (rSAM/lipoprotein system)
MKTKKAPRKLLRGLFAGLGLTTAAFVFQACYGTPQDMGLTVLIQGVVKSESTKKPIQGIKITLKDRFQYGLTDNAGKFQLYVPEYKLYTLQFDDIDGAENGSYSSVEISIDFPKDKVNLGEVFLNNAE